jgi:hypothetical protein
VVVDEDSEELCTWNIAGAAGRKEGIRVQECKDLDVEGERVCWNDE